MRETNYQLSSLPTYARKELRELVQVDKMSPDDRAKLFDEVPAILVRRLLGELSSTEPEATAQLLKIIVREGMAGALLGVILGTVATVWAYILQWNLAVAIAVGVSLLAIAILASIAGSALPFLFRSLGLDPALMSAPFITTAVDVLGVLIYFSLARLILQV